MSTRYADVDPVARIKARRAWATAPSEVYACAHCDYRTDRMTHAWVHGLVHGYGRVRAAAPINNLASRLGR